MSDKSGQPSLEQLRLLGIAACRASGASEAVAMSLVEATLSSELAGRPEVGFAHLPDYLEGMRAGRINGMAEPTITRPLPAFIHSDAAGGIAQLGFDRAFGDLVAAANAFGVAVFSQSRSYTAGEIGYYVRRLAQSGLVSIAAANAHAMVCAAPGVGPSYGTNPIAFGAPMGEGRSPLVFDQSTSATAFVNVARAASLGRAIPAGWAVDADGNPTTDAAEAVRGALLPAGGFKGANLALMVEVLSAGLSGGLWSLDAGHFRKGGDCPDIGLTVIAISPAAAPGFAERLADETARLAAMGVHIPGQRTRREEISIGAEALAVLRAAANRA
jgi:(2R)-3-sulfolactate dehydrogenase (NADP+)